jgi:hypothetical protein
VTASLALTTATYFGVKAERGHATQVSTPTRSRWVLFVKISPELKSEGLVQAAWRETWHGVRPKVSAGGKRRMSELCERIPAERLANEGRYGGKALYHTTLCKIFGRSEAEGTAPAGGLRASGERQDKAVLYLANFV